ncbi:HAMP domain-containing protein [Pleurocapsales cyanobacterium LEGE 06147]|nr:HAMP domain-containing protein [Pleurocapsales cyanobacterium LEGE 06147]
MTRQTKPQSQAGAIEVRKGLFWEARTRILVWYTALMGLFLALSIPLFYQLVLFQVNQRVREDLVEEVESFEEFIAQETIATDNLQLLFDRFLSARLVGDDNFLLTFIDGQFYKSSPFGLPPFLKKPELLARWAQLSTFEEGEKNSSETQPSKFLYLATPVAVDGQARGVFVAVHTTAGELEEAHDTLSIVINVLLFVLAFAFIFAWIASKKVLSPLRSLVQTTRSIGETDLNQRIPVRGTGEMRELAITFNQMMDRLEAAFQSQRDFVNDAGHELRTPITIIRGHLELIDDEDPQERQATIELVLDELERMTRLVEDLILLAKAERRDFLQLETVDLATLTEELYAKARGLASRDWQLEAKGEGKILVDRQRITQAVMNLAANATQHTTETDTIALGSSMEKQQVRLWVRDTGVGIELKDRHRIFQRFARASNSRRRSEGAGLGLAIVQAIVQSHQGCVELDSQLGVGSTFTLILPVEPKLLVESKIS